jgi:hypothetical protein
VCESRSACKGWLRALIEKRLTWNRALFRADVMVVSASEEMFSRVRTGSDCDHESLSRLSRVLAEVCSSLHHSDLRFRLAGLARFRSSADCMRFCIERTYTLDQRNGYIASSYKTPPCWLTNGGFRSCSGCSEATFGQTRLRLRPC